MRVSDKCALSFQLPRYLGPHPPCAPKNTWLGLFIALKFAL